jgi:MFS family permease
LGGKDGGRANEKVGTDSLTITSSKSICEKKIEIQEPDNWEILAFSYPTSKKWLILLVIFLVQVSMNFNASVYANAVAPLSEHFGITEAKARLGQMIFLIAYAFGSELWAPWSEELGRWPVMQLSLALVNVWQVLCALAPNFHSILIGRFLGGLSSAGGSVTLGMIADMWEPDDQQFAVAFIVLSSVAGSVVGPIAGGFIEVNLHWKWNFWIQLILGAAVQVCHFVLVPETRTTILLDREAKRQRKSGIANVYGPRELHGSDLSLKELGTIWARPFSMFFREPIVLFLSLLSGFSDALIFTFLESFQPVFVQWGFSKVQVGLAFIP